MHALLLLCALGAGPSGFLGTWSAELPVRGALLRGSVEIEPTSKGVAVTYKGETVHAARGHRGWWSARYPGAGTARVRSRGNGGYEGFWIQPRTVWLQAYATPLRFRPAGPTRFRAHFEGFSDATPLTIRISEDEGKMNVLFREREHNRTLRFRIDGIKVRGTQAVFTSSRGQPLQGRLIDDGNRMLLSLPWTDAPVVLKRSPEGRLPGFNSRVHGTQTPLRTPTADGEWPVVTLESAGVTRGPIEELVQELANAKPSSPVDPMVHALLVARGGSLVLEEYFFGHGPEDLHDTRSAGKSVGSMLVGAVA
ncbi:MAG: hypothetical protein AAFQ82_21530, partial [Myxococcota bacterium]